jgi:hypothetical protein
MDAGLEGMQMKWMASVLSVAGVMFAPTAKAQEDAAVFMPAGAWSLDYGEDYCRLARVFSDGREQVSLAMERIRPGAPVRVVLVGNGLKPFRRAAELGYSFLPGGREREVRYTQSATPDGQQYINLGNLTLDAAARGPGPGAPADYDRKAEQASAKGITALGIGKGLTKPVRIETGPLDAPVGALQACADDLVKSWGADPLGVQPVPEEGPSGWLPAGTIAFGDFAKLSGGSNQVRLMVDAAGKPTACHVHWATLEKDQNDAICATLMQKARFQPAKSAGGQAAVGYWVGDPMFMMPAQGGGRRG